MCGICSQNRYLLYQERHLHVFDMILAIARTDIYVSMFGTVPSLGTIWYQITKVCM